ncbi:MAG TPA: hypothetical protein VFR97_11770 [Capillimicrobium sp.]|nr:hypothetical protein [Capillimicrobium sp.]
MADRFERTPRRTGAVSTEDARTDAMHDDTVQDDTVRDRPTTERRTGERMLPRRDRATLGRHDVAAERAEFGGFSWGADFFGWLSAAGLAAILAGILGATGAALALNEVGNSVSGSEAETIGLAGGIGLLVVLAIAYFCGGYVAGRMARFDGARQGVGVWLWGIIAALAVAALALIGGSEYNVLDALNLPRIPVDSGTMTTGGVIALVASLVVTLVAAVLGGKVGERFHRKVDRVSLRDA